MNPEVQAMRERINLYYQRENTKRMHIKRKATEKIPNRPHQKTLKKLKPGTICEYCGEPLTRKNASLDHIIPLSRGGNNSPCNKAWCCKKCNFEKADKLPSELPEKYRLYAKTTRLVYIQNE